MARLATYGPSSADTCEKQGLRAQRGEDLRPTTQTTARVARAKAKKRCFQARRLATYGPSSGHKCKAQGLKAQRGEDLRPVARAKAKNRAREQQGAKT